jgi:uncharacterized membrane protein YeaQ/YmgE (transglycosylase-associated protein family)
MFHLIWYVLIGLISGVIAKSVMHAHMTIFWTIVLGILGSIIGGGVTHMFSRPTNEQYHPAGQAMPNPRRARHIARYVATAATASPSFLRLMLFRRSG